MALAARTNGSSFVYDVVVVGAGYAGAILAAILARKGYRVAVVERDAHPRFAIGESTTPEQNALHEHLGRRYNLRLLRDLADWPHVKAGRSGLPVWPKEMFYFLHNPAEHGGVWHETVDQARPFAPDFHVLRSALDVQLIAMAVEVGVDYFGPATIEGIDLDDPVRVYVDCVKSASPLRARFLVDATGGRGLLARQLDLVDAAPSDYWMRSRAVYSHFLGVRPLDAVADEAVPPLAIPRSHATVHHLQRDSWVWVIPFDDGVTSVGVVYRADLMPDQDDVAPDRLFHRVVAANPALAASMAGAVPIREYTHTPVLPWRARRSVGPNWALVGLASGFVDPLLSPGGVVSLGSVARFCAAIDDVLRVGRPAESALAPMARAGAAELKVFGQLLSCLYATFADPERFRAVYRVNIYGRILADLGYPNIVTGDDEPYPATRAAEYEPYAALVARLCRAFAPGATPPSATQIDAWLADVDEGGLATGRYLRPARPGMFVPTLAHGWLLRNARRSGGGLMVASKSLPRLAFLLAPRGRSWSPVAARPGALLWRHGHLLRRGI